MKTYVIKINDDSIMEEVLFQFAIFWNRKNGNEIGIPDPVDIWEFINKMKDGTMTKGNYEVKQYKCNYCGNIIKGVPERYHKFICDKCKVKVFEKIFED